MSAAPASVRERILQAILARLVPVAQQHQAALLRAPTSAIPPEQCPALLVFAEGDAIVERANDRVTRELSVRLTALAQAQALDQMGSSSVDLSTAAHSAQAQADALLVAAHAALFEDVNFAGLALGLKELEADWELDEADRAVCAIPARYAISYRCLAHDLSSLG